MLERPLGSPTRAVKSPTMSTTVGRRPGTRAASQHDGVAEVDVRGRRVDAQLHAQRAAEPELARRARRRAGSRRHRARVLRPDRWLGHGADGRPRPRWGRAPPCHRLLPGRPAAAAAPWGPPPPPMSEDDRRHSYEDAPIAGDARTTPPRRMAESLAAPPLPDQPSSEPAPRNGQLECTRPRPTASPSCGSRGRRRLAAGRSRPRRRAGRRMARGGQRQRAHRHVDPPDPRAASRG